MGVEDRRLGGTSACAHALAVALDVGVRCGAGILEPAPLLVRGPCGPARQLELGRAQVARRPDGDAGSGRQPGQASARLGVGGGLRGRRGGRRRRGRLGPIAVVVAEVLARERGDRLERRACVVPARAHEDLVALAHAERGHAGEAARVRRAGAGALVDQRDVGVEPSDGGHQASSGSSVQPEPVLDRHPQRLAAVLDDIGAAGVPVRILDAELHRLGRQRAARLRRHRIQVRPAARGRRGGDRALDQRRFAEHHPWRVLGHLDRHLGAHQRAAQVHEYEHAIVAGSPLDRALDELGIGADAPRRVGHAARGLDTHLLTAHLARELDHAVGDIGAVGDDDDADHRAEYRTGRPRAPW